MVFQNYALYPQLNVEANMGFALKQAQGVRKEERRAARARGRTAPRPRAVPRPEAEEPLRRSAPARRDGARDRPAPAGLPDGRAALEPRREAARADTHRARRAPVAARGHHRLRDPRPGRGDDDGASRRRAPRRNPAAVRHAVDALPLAGQPVRRGIHRLACHEPAARRCERPAPDRRSGRRHQRRRRRHGRDGSASAPRPSSSATVRSPRASA